jgi:hypothetical protein
VDCTESARVLNVTVRQPEVPPYSWFVVTNINELPPALTLGTTPADVHQVHDPSGGGLMEGLEEERNRHGRADSVDDRVGVDCGDLGRTTPAAVAVDRTRADPGSGPEDD